jgi:preprotein translocase subunit SecG
MVRHSCEENVMQDVMWIVVTIAFFGLSIAYVYFCEWVK